MPIRDTMLRIVVGLNGMKINGFTIQESLPTRTARAKTATSASDHPRRPLFAKMFRRDFESDPRNKV